MATIANIATYPGRHETLLHCASTVAKQVDVANIVLNEYSFVPSDWKKALPNANFIIPPCDHKDVGKFLPSVSPEDHVFLCDDDIVYPPDYVTTLKSVAAEVGMAEAIYGVHGVIYSDYYDGASGSGRLVYTFYRSLDRARVVNQLGTGTIYCRGAQMPDFTIMESAQRFVDVRFARYAAEKKMPLICIPRQESWMQEVESESTIYAEFTKNAPVAVVREIGQISGVSRIDAELDARLGGLNLMQRAMGT